MNGAIVDLLVSFTASLAASLLLAWRIPVPREPFGRHMMARVARVLGRFAIVVLTVAVGAGPFGRSALAVATGALGGWLVSSLWETLEIRRAGEHRR